MSKAARQSAQPTTNGPSSGAADGSPGDRALRAWVQVVYFRGQRLAGLRRTALASLPLWLGARWTLPGLLAWFALLLHASLAVETVAFAWLEHLGVHRAKTANAPPSVTLHFAWTTGQRLASGLWYGAAAVSLVPWLGVALGRPASISLRPLLPALAGAMSLLAFSASLLEGLGRRTGSHGPSPAADEAKVMKPSLHRT
jgi:hypothetical protein